MCIFTKPKVEPETIKPSGTKEVSLNAVWNILHSHFPSATIYLSDNTYWLCSYDDVALFLAQDETNKMEYVEEALDCDDFAYRLLGQFSIPNWSGIAFGILWTQIHALNCVITEDEKFYLVEPQTDELKSSIKDTEVQFIIM